MIRFAILQLRKERALLIGLAATIVLSFPFTGFIVSGPVPLPSMLHATALFWLIGGPPLFALIFGASCGAQLAGEQMRNAETLLPVPPARRAWGALIGSSVGTALLSGLIVVLAWGLHSSGIFNLGLSPLSLPILVISAGVLPHLLLGSMGAAYVSGHGVIGGLVGALTGGAGALFLFAGMELQERFPSRVSFTGTGVLACAGALVLIAMAIHWVSSLVDYTQRKRWHGPAVLFAALIAVLLAEAAIYRHVGVNLKNSTRLGRMVRNSSERIPEGALLSTLDGAWVWATDDGRRTLLVDGEDGGIFENPWKEHLFEPKQGSFYYDGAGVLWLLVFAPGVPGTYDLWSGSPRSRLKLISRFTSAGFPQVVASGGKVVLWTGSDGYAPVPPIGKQPRWEGMRKFRQRKRFVLASDMDTGDVAALVNASYETGVVRHYGARKNGVQLTTADGVKRFPFPGVLGVESSFVNGVWFGDDLVYPIPFSLSNQRHAVALCWPDGRVQTIWQGSSHIENLQQIGTGGLWGRESGTNRIRWVTEKGASLGPVSASAERVLHAEGDRLWLIFGGMQLVIDSAAKVVRESLLPDYGAVRPAVYSYYSDDGLIQVIKGGFFWHPGTGLYFIGWDGQTRFLGR